MYAGIGSWLLNKQLKTQIKQVIVLILTSRERDESSSLHKLALLVQKVSWVKGAGRLPLILVEQNRGQIGNYCNSLVIGMIMTIHKDAMWLCM